jgi:mannose-1-phosphate guanylyltransferase
LAKDLLVKDNKEELIFVFNSDVICDFPLEQLKKIHQEKKAEGTIILTKVSDPSKYGVVVTDSNNKIDSFVEKP